jgi:hypothetical protein
MRLGYTVFLEWGWSTYYDNNKEYKNMNYTLIENKDGFFNSSWGQGEEDGSNSKTFSGFLDKITEYRRKHDGNYDGLLAKVRNFNWTISENGTYDITLSLISVGDVIESLKTNIPPTKEAIDFLKARLLPPFNGNLLPSNNAILTYLSSFIISDSISGTDWSDGFKPFDNTTSPNSKGRFVTLDGLSKMRVGEKLTLYTTRKRYKKRARERIDETYEQYKEHINSGDVIFKVQTSTTTKTPFTVDKEIIIKNKLTPSEADDLFSNTLLLKLTVKGAIPSSTSPSPDAPQDLSSSGPKEVFVMNYIDEEENSGFTISSYYMRLGHLLQYINNTIIPIEKNTDEKIIKINTDQFSSNRMYKFPFQHSHNPRVCLVRSSYPIGLDKTTTPNTVEYQKALPDLPLWFKKGNDYAYLMNIYINFHQIRSSINDNLDEEGNLSLFDFLSSLCTAINKALGGVNNLEPVIEEETNTIKIIDGSYVSDEPPADDYILELYGYNTPTSSSNFVRNFSVKSTVSKEYASMISIGATAAGYTKGMEATMFSKWNTGITDRFKEEYVPNNEETPPTGSDNEAVRNYITDVLLKDLSRNEKKDGGFFLDTELINSQVNLATEFYKYCQFEFQQKNPKYGSPIIGFVPINLNLSMDGISGMKIYNAVRTSTRFLPKNYTDSLRFITKSVNHKLSNNDWETSIDTVVIPENYDKKGEAIILPYKERFEEVERILRECIDLINAPKPSGPLAKTRTNPNEGFSTGIDPAPTINPNKIGASGATNTPVYLKTKIDLRDSSKSQVLDLFKQGKLIQIGDANLNPKYFAKGNSKLQSVVELDNKYYLEKKAGQQFFEWSKAMRQRNIPFLVSSAVRFGKNTGAGPHGYGVAVDFSNLYQLVGGSTNPNVNKNARIEYDIYSKIAGLGTIYGWYNPWRLSDSRVGTNSNGDPFIDEMWHFEYWGPAE